jgi:hypothetical protein
MRKDMIYNVNPRANSLSPDSDLLCFSASGLNAFSGQGLLIDPRRSNAS